MATERMSLCNFCQRSYKAGLMCSWAIDFTPVKGWEAIYNPINYPLWGGQAKWQDSYFVKTCPEFLPDRKER